VAGSVVEDLVAQALLEAVDRNRDLLAEKARTAGRWLREQAEPPDGVELRTRDGGVYTGLVVVERNDVVLMLAVKHPTIVTERRPPSEPYQPYRPPRPLEPSYQQHHSRLWPEDEEDPYR
jgi:hypothetical protein